MSRMRALPSSWRRASSARRRWRGAMPTTPGEGDRFFSQSRGGGGAGGRGEKKPRDAVWVFQLNLKRRVPRHKKLEIDFGCAFSTSGHGRVSKCPEVPFAEILVLKIRFLTWLSRDLATHKCEHCPLVALKPRMAARGSNPNPSHQSLVQTTNLPGYLNLVYPFHFFWV